MSVAAHALIEAERRRQVEELGFSIVADDRYVDAELLCAGMCYLAHARGEIEASPIPVAWPWDARWWKPRGIREDLVRAGALFLAEIDRLGRAGKTSHHPRHRYEMVIRLLDKVEGWHG